MIIYSNLLKKDDSYYRLSRPELVPFLPINVKQMKVLEIGCGEGNFKNHLECNKYWGIEPSATAAEKAIITLDKVIVGNFDEVIDLIPNNFFDLVVCNDVIEHMNDVEYFLQIIKIKMKPEGKILGSIPNVRYIENLLRLLVLRDWKYTEWGILDKTHLRFFTRKSLKRLLIENQYQIIRLNGINPVSLKFGSFRSFFINLVLILSTFLFGRDTFYFQFGFLIECVESN